MNKNISDAIRTILKIGGAALATSGLLPAQCSVTDPALAQWAGIIVAGIGVIWGQISASHHQALKNKVEGNGTTV